MLKNVSCEYTVYRLIPTPSLCFALLLYNTFTFATLLSSHLVPGTHRFPLLSIYPNSLLEYLKQFYLFYRFYPTHLLPLSPLVSSQPLFRNQSVLALPVFLDHWQMFSDLFLSKFNCFISTPVPCDFETPFSTLGPNIYLGG